MAVMVLATQSEPRPRRRTQEERRAESSHRLLAAAVELMAEKGFERTTAMEIGERAGYSRSMVRARYGSKEALLESLVREEFEPLMTAPQVEGQTGLERALAMLEHPGVSAEREPAMLRAFFMLVFEAPGPVNHLAPWLAGFIRSYEAEVAAVLRRGRKDGSVGPHVDPEIEARQFIAYGLGIAFRWVLDPTRDFVGEMREWKERAEAEWRPRPSRVTPARTAPGRRRA
jgi:AcrR family transcriptional regulator